MTSLDEFVRGLPKAELHLHLEGALEPELMFDLAARNKVAIPFQSVEEIRAAYDFSNLQDFLDIYYAGAGVLQTEQDFYDLTTAYLERVSADGVRHVEAFFDPQTHTDRGLPFSIAADGILSAFEESAERFGVSAKLIMCFLRHLPEEAAFETLKSAEPYLDRIIGVGLDSSENGHPPSKFARVFEAARSEGLKLVAHAGEEGPPAYVVEALDILHVDRIDHGNRALEDPQLTERLAREGMTLTVCPLSNLKLCGVDDLKNHPLRRMLEAGLKATVNSDDPSYFGGYIGDNYIQIADALDLSTKDLATLARNSFEGSFLPTDVISAHVATIDAYVKAGD
ncbi:MAG: adenosine deaminase [Pseudomonadota bacterium]